MTTWRLNQWGTDGLEVAEKILTQEPRPTAVFAVTDHEAMYIYEAAAKSGSEFPKNSRWWVLPIWILRRPCVRRSPRCVSGPRKSAVGPRNSSWIAGWRFAKIPPPRFASEAT